MTTNAETTRMPAVVRRRGLSKLRPAVKTHGGKFYLAPWIISEMPDDYVQMAYCEPYCGGASVLLQKERSSKEIINDLDEGLIDVLRAIRDEPHHVISRLKELDYAETTFRQALDRSRDPFQDYLDRAVNEYTLRRMSRGGMRKAFAWSERLRGGQPGDLNAWETALAQLPALSERLRGVDIYCQPALDVIRECNDKHTLCYCDPPYLHETRTARKV